jgi:regulator of cell morphogenesis and NO signaling
MSLDKNGLVERQSAAELIDHIVNHHHAFTKKKLNEINNGFKELVSNEKNRTGYINDLLYSFARLKDDLEQHMRKEEFILFPCIKKLELELKNNSGNPGSQLTERPIRIMQKEHVQITGLMADIRSITKDFTPELSAHSELRLIYESLFKLEQDLHNHIYLENNVLFPKVAKLEKKLEILL